MVTPNKPVHARHGQPMMGDEQEPGRERMRKPLQHGAETIDIGVVQGRIDLVENADWRRVGEEDCKQERKRRQRLFASRKKRHHLQFLAGRACQNLDARLQRVFRVDEFEVRAAATEQTNE